MRESATQRIEGFSIDATVGATVGGRYTLKREIARGGMGTVFEAQHTYTGRSVAIKLLHAFHAADPSIRARLLREAHVLGTVPHPNVVYVLDAGEDKDVGAFVVMEMLEGRSLEGILASRRRLPVDQSVQLARQLCEALAAAHARGVVHRDIKPGNVFVARDERGEEVVKLFDFGIATAGDDPAAPTARKLTMSGELLGTPEYMAPEQLLAQDNIDHRCDFYAVGATLYECLTGEVPFEGSYPQLLMGLANRCPGSSVLAARPEISSALVAVIDRALAREPADRFADATAFARALLAAANLAPARTALLGMVEAPAAGHLHCLPAPAALPPSAGAAAPVRQPTLPVEPEPAAQRRRFPRAPYVTPVRIVQADGALLDGRSEDISEGGMLVITPRPCKDLETVKVRFAMPATGAIVTVAATARWVRAARDGRGAVGLEFSEAPPDMRAALAQYVDWMRPTDAE